MSFQLSTRDIRFPENQCNFPSKIIEALYHNRIVISTIQYSQLDGVKYFTVIPVENDFRDNIKRIVGLTQSDLLSYANQGELVSSMYSVKVWDKAMKKIESE